MRMKPTKAKLKDTALNTIAAIALGAALAFSLALVPGGDVLAQESKPDVSKTIEEAKAVQPKLAATLDPRTGLPTRLRGLKLIPDPQIALTASSGKLSDDDIRRAVAAFFAKSVLQAAFPQGHPGAKRVLGAVKSDPTLPGQYVVGVTQEVDGIPVFGSSGKVTLNEQTAVTGLTASFSPVDLVSTEATVTADEAIASARARLRELLSKRRAPVGPGTAHKPDPAAALAALEKADAKAQKMVFDPKLVKSTVAGSKSRMAWLVSIDSYRVFIDARNRNLLYFFNDYRSFVLRTVYDLSGKTVFPADPVIDDSTGRHAGALSPDALAAYRNIGAVRDYYFALFGRSGFDDPDGAAPKSGSPIQAYVRYGNIAAAFWCQSVASFCPKRHVGVYGPGFANALDVVGHEFTHGVIAFEAKLIYADEAGAVNEALADIMGTLIELHTLGDKAGNWVVGENLPTRSVAQPERSLAAPALTKPDGQPMFSPKLAYNADSNRGQPDHYSKLVKREDPLCDTTDDWANGCVHFNSGILNRFAYLTSEGVTTGFVKLPGIGREKLGQIVYRAITVKLNQTSDLKAAAQAMVDSCYEFVGANLYGFKDSHCKTIEAAQKATGLDTPSS
ncbi:MAG: M4 family metallopeptidase [Hyphomicrobiaceae bacterium]|nr:M4 family metallopeptidase [Hyphomicrobiaceae bacterium]